MNDKLKSGIATGLIALMIANFSACDKVSPNTPEVEKSSQATSGQISPSNSQSRPNESKPQQSKGSIWEAIRGDDIKYSKYESGLGTIGNSALPTSFLQDIGLLTYSSGKPYINGKHYKYIDQALNVACFIDENSPENDVYMLVQYNNLRIDSEPGNPNVYLSTWKLKYTLDDDNYRMLLNLDDDYRARYFVTEMDKQFEPEIVDHCTVKYRIMTAGSFLNSKDQWDKGFPYEYVADYDVENQTVTYAALGDDGYHFYDLGIMSEGSNWNSIRDNNGFTDEQMLNNIKIETESTSVGECLSKFTIFGYRYGLSKEGAIDLFNTTDRIHKLKEYTVFSSNRNYYDRSK